jgi:hypothetical protein
MAKIFISYRRDDSRNVADRIFDRLKKNYKAGEVFKDVSSIPVGENFVDVINNRISSAEVVLVVIGREWADTFAKRSGQVDFVKQEIASALQARKKVIPVFVEDVQAVPMAILPDEIKSIAQIHGIEVRPDPDFDNDIARLIQAINANLTTKTIYTPEKAKQDLFSPRNIYIGGLSLIAVVAAWFFMTREHCDYPKSGVLIANFMDKDRDGFSNSLVTHLDNALPDSLYDVRPVGNQKREVKNYSEVIATRYFKSKCQPSGIFINGFLDREQQVFNLYANLVNMKIDQPEFVNDNSVFLENPDNVEFSIREDAKFVAQFILSIIDVYGGNEKRALENLTVLEANQKVNLKDPEFLATVALYKGNCYALRGDETRAKKEYQKAKKSNKPEVEMAAQHNILAANAISESYQDDPLQAKQRKRNITEHGSIEKKLAGLFERELDRKLEEVVKGIFN